MPVHDAAERARLYRNELVGSAAWRALKEAMDLWCACWFWPADQIEHAPLPSDFAEPPAETRTVARRVAVEMRFFHWELEFPDVFREAGSGFDALLGNPPWENLQPNPEEFFSNRDPLFRTYGRLEKLRRQQDMFREHRPLEGRYLDYVAGFKNVSNWIGSCVNPCGDPDDTGNDKVFFLGKGSRNLHRRWSSVRRRERSYSDDNHPFRFQMGRIFTYQLFMEQSFVLTRAGGRCGIIIPSGIYSDAWSKPLRDLLLQECRWEWLFGIENRTKIFPIHRSYKFNPLIVEKGGTTEAIRTSFMRHDLNDWERAEDIATPYTLAQIKRFSPKSHAILEIRSREDLEVLEKIYGNAVLLGNGEPDDWSIEYNLEFMMNTDAHLFPSRPQWEAKDYRPDEYSRWLLGDWRPIGELWEEMGVNPSRPAPTEIDIEVGLFDTTAGPERRETEARFVHGHWLKPGDITRTEWRSRCAQPPYDGLPIPRVAIPTGVVLSRDGDAWIRDQDVHDVALPFMQGVMLNQFDFGQKRWLSGTGLLARWESVGWNPKTVEPQFLMSTGDAGPTISTASKIAFRRIAGATDARTMIASVVARMPCGDTAAVLKVAPGSSGSSMNLGFVVAALNSLAVDAIVRMRIVRTHVDYHFAREVPLPAPNDARSTRRCGWFGIGLNLATQLAGPEWIATPGVQERTAWRTHWFLTDHARVRVRAMVDAVIACLLGLNPVDFSFILRSCDRPDPSGDSKGFWRVDRGQAPELRHTVLALVAFHDLQAKIDSVDGDREKGVEAFLSQNDGEGWMLPETLRLADYGLGHDERSRQPQPVASRLGPRFYDWQLVQSADESWRECHLHARNLLGENDYALRIVDLIERRMADGEDYLGLLTDRFTRDLLGDSGYVTALVEIRTREILYESSYRATVTDLRNGGHLDDGNYNQLLDRLHARNLLDDVGHHRRRGRGMPAPAAGLPAQRAAESRAGHQADLFPQKKQRDLFE